MTMVSERLAGELPADHGSATNRPVWVSWAQAPFFALQFLTVLPPTFVRRVPDYDDFGRSDAFFPAVGLLLGAILAAADWLLAPYLAESVRNVGLVALLAAMTGGLHLDGLIDTFDGLFAGPDAARRLDVMRDPRAGSFGVVAVVLQLGLKVAAISSLPPPMRGPALILAPCLGRWGIVLVTGAFAYARPSGMGRSFKDSIRWQHVMVASGIAIGGALAMAGLVGAALWLGVSLLVLAAGGWVSGRLGGLTGDVYGAVCELVETSVLVALGLRLGGVV
ncbi:MAG: adenosylcobinamide-GDP ribazoletransferase [Chloroflexota bacterium]